MNILIKLFIMVILLYSTPVWGASYYVSSTDGNDSGNGTSQTAYNAKSNPNNCPWKTMAKVNRILFSDGDILYLKRGDVWTDAGFAPGNNLPNNFTLTAYGTGSLPLIDANTVRPITIFPTKVKTGLLIKDIDISGQDWQEAKDSNIIIINIKGLILDGIYGNGHYNGGKYGKTGITIFNGCTGEIEVKNCTLFNYGPSIIPSEGIDFMGLVVMNLTSGAVIKIHDNVIYNTNADSIQLFKNTATAIYVYNNKLYNGGENSGLDIKSSGNVTVYDNEIYREDSFTGTGGSGGGSLIGVHDPERVGIKNIIIRNNVMRPNDKNAINLKAAQNVKIYENSITGNGLKNGGGVSMSDIVSPEIYRNIFASISGAILIGGGSIDPLIHHNVILNPLTRSATGSYDAGGIYQNNIGIAYVFNNTIVNLTGTAANLISIESSYGSLIINNIAYQGLTIGAYYPLHVGPYGTPATVSNNIWYSAGNQGIKYNKTVYTNIDSWIRSGHSGESFSDPLFVSTGTKNSLQQNSPAIDAGINLGFTTDYIGNKIPCGSDPDIGAYEYSEENSLPPLPPKNLKAGN